MCLRPVESVQFVGRDSNSIIPPRRNAKIIQHGNAQVATAVEQELPPAAKILDPDIIFYDRPQPTISTDGKWVAYISKGYVCICNSANPKPDSIV